jgi:hypothetical protein
MQEMHKGSYTYATKELPHTKLTNHQLLEGRQKGLDTAGKRAKERKTHKLPLNTCTRAKEHTKLTASPYTHEIEKEQNKPSGLTKATHLKVTNTLTFIISSQFTHRCPPSPKVMHLHVTTGI